MASRASVPPGDQLGFAFDLPAAGELPPPAAAQASPAPPVGGARPAPLPSPAVDAAGTGRPARGTPPPGATSRSAMRARTAVLFSRLQALGLRGIDRLVLMRTRTVMVSVIGRTLRLHDDFANAPEPVLRAIVAFATARTRAARAAARDVILQYPVERTPAPRRPDPPRPGDVGLLTRLAEAHRQLNARHFGGRLAEIPLRLSGRMATRLGHFDPGSELAPAEIVLSRRHIQRHGWREALHTLLHEMVHQWQHETGAAIDHGPGFRRKAREVGITPAARREVAPPPAPAPASSRPQALAGWWDGLW